MAKSSIRGAQIIIIFVSIYAFLRWSDKNSLNDYEKIILFLVFLWLVNQIFSDIINKIDFIDYIRGNAKILVTFLSFYVFFKLSKLKNFSLIKMLFWILLVQIFHQAYHSSYSCLTSSSACACILLILSSEIARY